MDFSSNIAMDKGNKGEILLYQTEDGASKIEVTLSEDTVWLTLDRMAELFQRNKSTISRHIKNIFESGELQPDSVVAFFATTAADGKSYQVCYYNLDVIISVGYRVNSLRGVQFRIWATQVLREYLVKGFAVNWNTTNSAAAPPTAFLPSKSISSKTLNGSAGSSATPNLKLPHRNKRLSGKAKGFSGLLYANLHVFTRQSAKGGDSRLSPYCFTLNFML